MDSIAHPMHVKVVTDALHSSMISLHVKIHFHNCFTLDSLVESFSSVHYAHLRNKTHWSRLYFSRWPPCLACTSCKLYTLSLWWLEGLNSSHPHEQSWLVVGTRKSWLWLNTNQNFHLTNRFDCFFFTFYRNIIENHESKWKVLKTHSNLTDTFQFSSILFTIMQQKISVTCDLGSHHLTGRTAPRYSAP